MSRKVRGRAENIRPDGMSTLVINQLIERTKIDPVLIEEVMWSCANQAGEDNRNVGRMAALLAGLSTLFPPTRSIVSAVRASTRSTLDCRFRRCACHNC